MREELKNSMDKAMSEAIADIPNLVQKQVRQVIIDEICRQLNLRYSYEKYSLNHGERTQYSNEIRDYIRAQFSDVMQKNITELLPKRDMTQILKEARKSVDEAIKMEFNSLWRTELKIAAEREAQNLLKEVKEGLKE